VVKTSRPNNCKMFRIDSYGRYFRWVIEEKLLEKHGLEIIECTGKYKTWKVQELTLFEV